MEHNPYLRDQLIGEILSYERKIFDLGEPSDYSAYQQLVQYREEIRARTARLHALKDDAEQEKPSRTRLLLNNVQHLFIIVVEDNEAERFFLKEIFDGKSFDLHFASSSDECLKTIESRQPDLIIFHATMPGVDARDVCVPTRNRIPIIFLSRLDKNDEMRSCLKNPVHRYITKPYTPDTLVINVQQLLH